LAAVGIILSSEYASFQLNPAKPKHKGCVKRTAASFGKELWQKTSKCAESMHNLQKKPTKLVVVHQRPWQLLPA